MEIPVVRVRSVLLTPPCGGTKQFPETLGQIFHAYPGIKPKASRISRMFTHPHFVGLRQIFELRMNLSAFPVWVRAESIDAHPVLAILLLHTLWPRKLLP